MLLDKQMLFADGLAHDGTTTVLNLETASPGPGRHVKCFITGSSTLAGCTGFVITDGTTSTAAGALLTHVGTLAGKTIEFDLPSDVAQYVKCELSGTTTAGTWTAGVVMPGVQTAQ